MIFDYQQVQNDGKGNEWPVSLQVSSDTFYAQGKLGFLKGSKTVDGWTWELNGPVAKVSFKTKTFNGYTTSIESIFKPQPMWVGRMYIKAISGRGYPQIHLKDNFKTLSFVEACCQLLAGDSSNPWPTILRKTYGTREPGFDWAFKIMAAFGKPPSIDDFENVSLAALKASIEEKVLPDFKLFELRNETNRYSTLNGAYNRERFIQSCILAGGVAHGKLMELLADKNKGAPLDEIAWRLLTSEKASDVQMALEFLLTHGPKEGVFGTIRGFKNEYSTEEFIKHSAEIPAITWSKLESTPKTIAARSKIYLKMGLPELAWIDFCSKMTWKVDLKDVDYRDVVSFAKQIGLVSSEDWGRALRGCQSLAGIPLQLIQAALSSGLDPNHPSLDRVDERSSGWSFLRTARERAVLNQDSNDGLKKSIRRI